MMELSFGTKINIGLYVIKNMMTKPTFNKYNPDDAEVFYRDPNPVNDEMRRNHPIFFCPKIAAWVCSLNRDEVFAMAKNDSFSVNFNDWRFVQKQKPDSEKDALEKLLTSLLMSLEHEDHMRIRRLVQPAFLPKNIARMEPVIEKIIEEILSELGNEFNLIDVTNEVPLRVVADLVGVPQNFRAEFKGLADSIMATYTPIDPPDTRLAYKGIEIVRGIIEDRRVNPTDDFISILVQTADEDGDHLSIDEVMAFVASLLTAGPDTTSHYLNFSMYALLTNPEVIKELLEKPELIPDAIVEALRLNYVGHSGGIRFACEDTEIRGHKIEKGDMIKFNINTANLDPSVFPDPATYNIHRDNLKDAWVFGAGSHFCVGASLARMIGVCFIRAFIKKFPNVEMVGMPEYEKDFINRKMTTMMVRFNHQI